jgi:hypothetical protein
MTKIERIEDLLGQVEDDIKTRTVKNILADLKEFLKDGVPDSEKAGMKAAIEIIETNYV